MKKGKASLVPKSLAKGEKVTIRCTIKPPADYQGTKYYTRYFQFLYALAEQQFRLYYVSESTVTHSFDIWVSE